MNGSAAEEKAILEGKGPVKFEYKDNFYGVPLSDSIFYSYPKILRPSQNAITYSKTKI